MYVSGHDAAAAAGLVSHLQVLLQAGIFRHLADQCCLYQLLSFRPTDEPHMGVFAGRVR
jgi:hypothetical protein